MNQIIPTAEPFFFPGKPGQPGCLLIHGFTGAPKELRWMGEYLSREHGIHCLGVRLTGHATQPEAMIRSRYTDWVASVEDGYHLLRGVTERIYLVGLSMGGVLTLLMSTKLDVVGAVAMSTPYHLPLDVPAWVLQSLSLFLPYRKKANVDSSATWFDHAALAGHISYPKNPIRSASELQKLSGKMRAVLPDVNVPVLLIHSKNDHYVPQDSMENIYADLGAPDKTKLWVTESGHVITRDAERETAFQAAADFVHRIEASA